MTGPDMVTGGGAGRGRVRGRLPGWFGGVDSPVWALVAVGGRASDWPGGACSFVVTVAASGPVRVHYTLSEPAGPTWLRLVRVSERRRRRVLRAVLGCGALEGAGPRAERAEQAAGAGSGDAGVRAGVEAAGDVEGVSAFGWLHVAAGNVTVWTDLPEDGRVGGVAVRDLVVGLVPRRVWRELHALASEAWQTWAWRAPVDRTRPDPRTCSCWGPGLDDTPGGWPGVGPDGGAGGGEGWPGIRRGGGLGVRGEATAVSWGERSGAGGAASGGATSGPSGAGAVDGGVCAAAVGGAACLAVAA